MEPRGSEMAGTSAISERMEETADYSVKWKVRNSLLRGRFQTSRSETPCGPHRASTFDPAIKGWESRPPREPSMYYGTCHGYKLQADHKLCLGDKLGYLEVRDPRITRKSLEDACKTGRLTASLHDQPTDAKESATIPSEEGPAPTLSNNSKSGTTCDPSKPPRSCRAKRICADVARQLNVDASVIEQLIFRGLLKLYDPRVTENSLTKFCGRYGALIKSDFLDRETRDWLADSMDLAPSAGKDEAGRLEAFRKHALVVRTCEHCGRAIRGNVFFRHNKRCPQLNTRAESKGS